MKSEYDNIPTGATTAAMNLPSKAGSGVRSGGIGADTVIKGADPVFSGSGGYTYEVQADGGIKIVSSPGSNTGLVVYPEGRNAKAYSAIAKEIASQLTPETAILAGLLGENNAKAEAYKPPTPAPKKPSGPTAGAMGLIAEGEDIVRQNAQAAQDMTMRLDMASTPPAKDPTEIGGDRASKGFGLTAIHATSADPMVRSAAQIAMQFDDKQNAVLESTYETLRAHTGQGEAEAYRHAVSAASRVAPASPRSAPSTPASAPVATR